MWIIATKKCRLTNREKFHKKIIKDSSRNSNESESNKKNIFVSSNFHASFVVVVVVVKTL